MAETTKGEVIYEIKMNDSKLEADLEKINEKIEEAAEETAEDIIEISKEVKKKIKKHSKKIVEEVEEAADKVADAWKFSNEKVEKEAEGAADKVADEWEESCEKIVKAMSGVEDEKIVINLEVEGAQAEKEAKTAIGNIKDELKKTMSEEIPLVGSIGSMTDGLSGFKENAIGVAAAIATEALQAADQMEQAMDGFLAYTGKGKEEMEHYQQILENIYQQGYGESFSDVAGAIAEVVQVMGDMDDESLQNMVENAFALQDVFAIDISESINTAKELMDEYGISSEEAMNMISIGAKNGITNSEEFLNKIGQYCEQFEGAKISAEDMFTIFGEGASDMSGTLEEIKANQGDNLSAMFEKFKNALDILLVTLGEAFMPLLQTLVETVLPAVQGILIPVIELFAGLVEPILLVINTAITPLIEIFNVLMNEVLIPFIKIIRDLLVPTFTGCMEGASHDMNRIIENVKSNFFSIIDFIKNVFTGNWNGAWENIKSIFKGIVDSFETVMKRPLNTIIDAINGFINGVNKIKMPDWVPGIGGKGFHISRIPRLKVGLDYVPSDYFPAFLDEGEAVLTKEENAIYRSLGGLEGMISLSKNPYPDLFRLSADAAPIIIHSHLELDGKEVGNSITRYVDMNLSETEYLRRRGN